MNKRVFFIIFVLCFTSISFADEAQELYTSEELILTQTITGSFRIDSDDVSDVEKINANLVLFPKDTLRQKVISEQVNPLPLYRDEHSILFQFNNPSVVEEFSVSSQVRTRNNYIPVQSKISYPIDSSTLPDDILVYLEETSFIDITPQIKQQAQELATSDDLFNVSFTVASWVRNNIEYNLSTITADASQSASWVFENRRGVCDELSTLYISMMRSLGVPARFVSGISYTNSPLFTEKWNNHAWVEVYMGEYGWIPFDLTYGQFGYIDATHISFQTSIDSKPSKTVYTWESRGSESVDVEFGKLDFETTIDAKRSRIVDFFSTNVSLVHNKTGFDSWNALIVSVSNNYNHYVTANMQFVSSQEIRLEKEDYSFYLEPFETKVFTIPFYVPQLDGLYEYTLPFTFNNYYSQVGNIRTKSAQRFASYSYDQIQKKSSLLLEESESSPLAGVNAFCIPPQNVFVNETMSVECTITSENELSGTFCFEENCSSFDVKQNDSQNFTYDKTIYSYGEYIFDIKLIVDSLNSTVLLPVQVNDRSSLSLTQNSGYMSGEYGDTFSTWFVLEKDSYSPAKNIMIKIGDAFPYVWEMGTLYSSQNLSVDVESIHLKPGKNMYPIIVWYEDISGNKYSVSSYVELELENITFWQRIKLFFAQLLL